MRLSTKGRYGTRAMLDLVMHQDAGPVKVREIAEREGISPMYLERLMARLASRGLVRPVRGRGGGFVLSRPASKITLGEIVEVLEGRIAVVECVAAPSVCGRALMCATRGVWEEVSQRINRVLDEMTLEDLRQQHLKKQDTETETYHVLADTEVSQDG